MNAYLILNPNFTGLYFVLDVKCLVDSSKEMGNNTKNIIAGLSEQALWFGGTPIWASRCWVDLKD